MATVPAVQTSCLYVCVCVCVELCLSLQICQVINEVSAANQELLRKYKREMNLRKKCHNELVRLKGSSLRRNVTQDQRQVNCP